MDKYEKLYNEALERFKSFKEKYYTKDTNLGDVIFDKNGEMQKDFNGIFPELAESEDEKNWKIVMEYVKDDALRNWLEKQKETHYTKRNALFDKCVAECDPAVMKEVSDEIDEMLGKEQKPKIPKPHKGDDNNPYDMSVSEAQEYAIKRGFGIPFNDGEVYVDERHLTQTIGNILRWADEHPKEQKPNYCHHEVDETGWSDEYRKAYYDGWNNCNIQHDLCKKEQKPTSTEDMPYITDEHFYEREPVDSFKYKLAEYMTKCCTKKEGPYGYEYGISAETILKMAEEELLKRGVVQKPAEWSEEDEENLGKLHRLLVICQGEKKFIPLDEYDKLDKWLKSLRSSWKPSEVCYGAKGDPDPAGVWKPSKAQIAALRNSLDYLSEDDYDDMLELYEQLKKLM